MAIELTKGLRQLTAALFYLFAFTILAQPAFQPLEFPRTNEVRLRLTTPAATFSRVDASTNLTDWYGLVTASAGSLIYTNAFTTFTAPTARYYRAESITNAGT